MSLDVLLEPLVIPVSRPCKVGRLILELEEPYKSAVVKMMDTPYMAGGLTDEGIAARLMRAEKPIGASTVRTHRKGVCSCG